MISHCRFFTLAGKSIRFLPILIVIVRKCRDKVVDFHFNSSDPWTIVSVSDDCESTNGGGTLQVMTNL